MLKVMKCVTRVYINRSGLFQIKSLFINMETVKVARVSNITAEQNNEL